MQAMIILQQLFATGYERSFSSHLSISNSHASSIMCPQTAKEVVCETESDVSPFCHLSLSPILHEKKKNCKKSIICPGLEVGKDIALRVSRFPEIPNAPSSQCFHFACALYATCTFGNSRVSDLERFTGFSKSAACPDSL